MKAPRILFTLLFSMVFLGASAQFSSDEFNTSLPPQDSLNDGTDTLDASNSIFDIFTGKPGKAAFYSLLIPGGGQYYNQRYWKIPLVLAAEGGAIYWLVFNSQKLNTWQDGYLAMRNGEVTEFMGSSNVTAIKGVRDGYRKNKEYAYIVVIIAHLVNVFDAFIDRHLIDFDIDDDLSYNDRIHFNKWTPATFGELSINIPLQKKTQRTSRKIFEVY